MKEGGFQKKVDRRQFVKGMSLGLATALITTSPLRALAQEDKNRIPEITILYYTVIAEQDDIWKLVTQDWKKLGLEIKLKVAAFAVVQKISYSERNFDISSISWGPTNERLDPTFHLEEHFHSRNKDIGGRNYGYYVNPEFDKYCDLQKSELDRNKRREYVWKCQEILAKDYPAWYFGYTSNIQAYNSRDWEGVVPFPGSGIGGFLSPWTYLNIRPKAKRNTIRVAVGSVNTGLNPFAPQHIGQEGQLRFIYDTYLKIKPDLETGPWAAESWKIVNPKTVDITLRSGMKFHDGKPVTVEDVKFTWDYTKKWAFPMYNWVTDTVDKTEILDNRTVRFHLVRPHAPFIDQVLTYAIILPKHIWEKIPESAGVKSPVDWGNAQAIGSGPFKLGYWRKGEEGLMRANKEHWHAPHIDGLIWREQMAPDARVSGLIAGEVDISSADMRPSQAKTLERHNYLKVVINPSHRLFMARPNMQRKPFDDREFRRALFHAINLKKIHQIVFEGAGDEGRNTPISPVFKVWHNSKIPPIDFSLDKARQILKDAGYSWDNAGRLCFPKGK
jgi:peptide/nickel transport system substrate-binding protein